MIQRNKNSKDVLRSQISFLKSFDQKLEGLTREKERLKKIIANAKLRFSRSSLGGLHRIVNGLKSAGPVFGFSDIEEWAKNTDNWLRKLGKLSDKPSEDDLKWLENAIQELSGLRDAALKQAEETAPDSVPPKSAEAATVTAPSSDEKKDADDAEKDATGEDDAEKDTGGEDDTGNAEKKEASDDPEKRDTPKPPPSESKPKSSEKSDSPFADEPKERSLKQSEFAGSKSKADETSKNSDKGRRDPSSTIPLGIDDLAELGRGEDGGGPRSTIPLAIDDLESLSGPHKKPMAPPPVRRSVKKGQEAKGSGIWKAVAVIAILGFALMTVLYLKDRGEAQKQQVAAVETPTPPPVTEKATPPEPEEKPAGEETPSVDTAKEDSSRDKKPSDATAVEKTANSKKKSDSEKRSKAERRKKRADDDSSSSRKEKRAKKMKKETTEKADSQKPKPKPKPAAVSGDTGTLFVKAVSGASVTVLVDGVSKGRAPVRTKLKPGIHEITFIANGKRAMQVVPIRAGKTKTVQAKIP